MDISILNHKTGFGNFLQHQDFNTLSKWRPASYDYISVLTLGNSCPFINYSALQATELYK